MAGGKASARQKMINLMYLVFIAMMALNMSKEVLSAFGLMNEKLDQANVRSGERNAAFMADLEAKVEEQPEKYKPELEKAKQLGALSDDLSAYLQGIKDDVIFKGATEEDKTNYESMDKSAALDEYFFNSGAIGPNGKEFVEKINTYRDGVVALLSQKGTTDYTDNIKSLQADFDTNPIVDTEGVK